MDSVGAAEKQRPAAPDSDAAEKLIAFALLQENAASEKHGGDGKNDEGYAARTEVLQGHHAEERDSNHDQDYAEFGEPVGADRFFDGGDGFDALLASRSGAGGLSSKVGDGVAMRADAAGGRVVGWGGSAAGGCGTTGRRINFCGAGRSCGFGWVGRTCDVGLTVLSVARGPGPYFDPWEERSREGGICTGGMGLGAITG